MILTLSDFDIEKLREVIRLIPDGHVMLQTVNLEPDYTGMSDFDIQ